MALEQSINADSKIQGGIIGITRYFPIITDPLCQSNCNQVDTVFDQYWKVSIKAEERLRQGSAKSQEIKINSLNTPVPKQWVEYMTNSQNKVNLCHFLTESFCNLGKKNCHLTRNWWLEGVLMMAKKHCPQKNTKGKQFCC